MIIAYRQNQRTSISTKEKQDWRVHNLHYWFNLAVASNDISSVQDNIDAANGIVDSKTYEYVLNPLQAGGNKIKNLPGMIRDIDFITPIREKNIGEYIELPDIFTVKVDDPDIVLKKNSEIQEKIKPIIEQAIINKINEQQEGSEGSGVPSKDIGDIDKIIDDIVDTWFDDRATTAQHLIEYIKDYNNYDTKILAAFMDWWSTEKVYYRVFNINDEVYFENINVLHGLPIDNGEEFIEDNDGFIINRTISIDAIKEHYDDELTSKDKEYLQLLIDKFDSGATTMNTSEIVEIYGRKIFTEDNYADGVEVPIAKDRNIREIIVYFKTEVPRYILSKYNSFGEVVNEVVEKDYELNYELGDIEVNREWITEVWKQVLLGEDYTGIYLKPVPVDIQEYDSKGHCKLPIIGKSGVLNNIYINPIPKRIISSLALYRIIVLQIERQMAKYKGTMEIIPQSLLEGADGDVKGNMFYKLADNTYIYDDSEISVNTIQNGYRLVGNDAAVNYIKALIDLRNDVKAEAWDMANMNDSRYGNAAPSSTVTNNNQNIIRAKLGSILMVTVFNQVKTRLFTKMLEYGKVAYVNGKRGVNFDKDGKTVYYNLNEGELTENRYGIFVSNSVLDFNKLKEYKDLAFSAAQHGEFELATEAIDSDNLSNVREKIKEFNKAKKEYEKSVEQQKIANDKAISDSQIANDEDNRNAKLKEIELKEKLQLKREVRVKGMELANSDVTYN